MHKNQPFLQRSVFALAGLAYALRSESSFRTQVVAAMGVVALLVWLRPAPVWWGLVLLTCAIVLAAELFNTAVEVLADHLHPEQHPRIKVMKDCAAGAVLIASVAAVGVAAALLFEVSRR
jgi:diacylglycerol kinase (ATP)